MEKIRKTIYLILGILCTVLGFLGIILPVLPTTPFLLLASFLFLKSSKRLNHWINHHPVFGQYISDYQKYRGVDRKNKIRALVFTWLTMAFSIYKVSAIPLKIMLLCLLLGVTYHVTSLRTLTDDVRRKLDVEKGNKEKIGE